MRLVNTIAIMSIALLLWSVVIGYGAYEWIQFQKMQVDVGQLRGAVSQIAQVLNSQGQIHATPGNSTKTPNR